MKPENICVIGKHEPDWLLTIWCSLQAENRSLCNYAIQLKSKIVVVYFSCVVYFCGKSLETCVSWENFFNNRIEEKQDSWAIFFTICFWLKVVNSRHLQVSCAIFHNFPLVISTICVFDLVANEWTFWVTRAMAWASAGTDKTLLPQFSARVFHTHVPQTQSEFSCFTPLITSLCFC